MVVNHNLLNKIRIEILEWSLANPRQMPWSGEKSPYKIWISEIILQQTRVKQGWDYYLRFIQAFPDIHTLAEAETDEVLKLWEGLGYYTRARNIHHTAKQIVLNGGHFPEKHSEILQLKGIGPYTAAAISSFAFNLPHAVIDGNVVRVLARIFGLYESFHQTSGKKIFVSVADQLLDKKEPAIYNQAIMNFGALICKPAPECSICPISQSCYAFLNVKQSELPISQKKIEKKQRHLLYHVYLYQGKTWIRKRDGKDIWNGLYEFPIYEFAELNTALQFQEERQSYQDNANMVVSKYSQTLTHQYIEVTFIFLETCPSPQEMESQNLLEVAVSDLEKFPFPILLQKAMKEYFKIAIHL